jgi:hypothetical protein
MFPALLKAGHRRVRALRPSRRRSDLLFTNADEQFKDVFPASKAQYNRAHSPEMRRAGGKQ